MSLLRSEPLKLILFTLGNPCRKRYDMIALLLQTAPKVHYDLPKAIITLDSPKAILAGDLLCGMLAKPRLCYFSQK